MDIDKENRPLCDCHNKSMFWHKRKNNKNGGTWVCIIKKRIYDIKYRNTVRGRLLKNKINRKQYITPGTTRYERDNPNGYLYGESLRKKAEQYDKKTNERDLNKLWQLLN